MHVTMAFKQEQERIVMLSLILSIGLVGYFPQEVFSNYCWTPGVDIYALGMTIIHFLSQKAPSLFSRFIND